MNRPDHNQELRQWALFLHLSQFSGIIIPFGGLIIPIIIWQVKKDELPGIEKHGRMVVNWLISSMLYSFVAIVLLLLGVLSAAYEIVWVAFLLVPVASLIVAVVVGCGFVFPIIGGVKANEGKVWNYPLTLEIFN